MDSGPHPSTLAAVVADVCGVTATCGAVRTSPHRNSNNAPRWENATRGLAGATAVRIHPSEIGPPACPGGRSDWVTGGGNRHGTDGLRVWCAAGAGEGSLRRHS